MVNGWSATLSESRAWVAQDRHRRVVNALARSSVALQFFRFASAGAEAATLPVQKRAARLLLGVREDVGDGAVALLVARRVAERGNQRRRPGDEADAVRRHAEVGIVDLDEIERLALALELLEEPGRRLAAIQSTRTPRCSRAQRRAQT